MARTAEQIPHDRDALRALVEKVRAAEGPDRDLDAEIWWLFADHGQGDPSCAQDVARLGVPAAMDLWWGKPWRAADTFARVTESIDAATALMDRALPGWDYHLWRDNDYDGQYVAEMIWPKGALTPDAGYFGCDGRAATRALAIVHGILESKLALLAQAEADVGGQHAQ